MELKWKQSRLRFYIKNVIWNYVFWLKAKPHYTTKKYKTPIRNLNGQLNESFDYYYDIFESKFEIKESKKFVGYMFEGAVYLDNPGMQGEDEQTWKAWVRKGLV